MYVLLWVLGFGVELLSILGYQGTVKDGHRVPLVV